MSWYKCLMTGRNFPGSLVGERELVGFYTTCFVEAKTPETAQVIAIRQLEADERLHLSDQAEIYLSPTVTVEEMVEVHVDEVPEKKQGIAWYAMEDEASN